MKKNYGDGREGVGRLHGLNGRIFIRQKKKVELWLKI